MIISNKSSNYNLLPSSTHEEIAQNISVILSTYKGTVPLNREFGLNTSFIDMTTKSGINIAKFHIGQAINKYEPRVEVINISIIKNDESAIDGDFEIKVEVKILDEFK